VHQPFYHRPPQRTSHFDEQERFGVTTTINPACSIKRRRRTKTEMLELRFRLAEVLRERNPQTIRQVFYQMVSRGAIEKTEREYDNVVSRLLTEMREQGDIPWSFIVDGTRWQRKPHTYSGIEQALNCCAVTYRRALWNDQNVYVEVWCEKDALSGILYPITSEYDVPLMVVRGFSSVTFLHEAAETIDAVHKPAFIYYFGDFDSYGRDISRDVEAKLQRYAPLAEIEFHRVAVNQEQIAQYNLPTRPDKKDRKPAVELDALPVEILQDLARAVIGQHIDQRQLEITKLAEESEREIFSKLMTSKTLKHRNHH
jgi:hypothetical protein